MTRYAWIAALCALATTAHALPKEALTIDDIAHEKDAELGQLSFSQGTILGAYTSASGATTITRFMDPSPDPLVTAASGSLSPDGRWLLYLAGTAWVLRDNRTSLERRFELDKVPRGNLPPPVWSPDSRFVAAHFDFIDISSPPVAVTQVTHGAKVEVISDTPEAIHKRAVGHFHPHVLLWNVGKDRPLVSESEASETFSGEWSITSTGEHIYYYAVGDHPYGGQISRTAVCAQSMETGLTREVIRLSSYNQSLHPKISPDGETLAFAADLDAKAFGVANNVVVADIKSGKIRALTHDQSVSSVLWGSDGAIYALARNGAFQELERVTLDGRLHVLTHDGEFRTGGVASADRMSLAYTTVDGYGLKALRVWSVPRGVEQTRAIIADPGARFRLGRFQQVSWTTPDGLALKGLVVLPPDYDPSHRYPMFVDVHGGGPGSRLYLWSVLGYPALSPLEWHLWATLGYVVFVPDYRSSGGYGAAVNTARTMKGERNGDLGGIDQDVDDVQSGVRWMLQRGDIDPSRVAVFGQSAGGGRVNDLLTRSRLFAAGIIHDPIDSGAVAEDLEEATEALPITWYGTHLTPADRQAQLSGFLFDGWHSTTPTLIMVGNPALGALDPLSAETLYAMLQSVHVPTRFVRFMEDGHNAASPAGVEARFAEMKAWLDRYAPSSPRGNADPAPL
jgi:dienelactone hydrolase